MTLPDTARGQEDPQGSRRQASGAPQVTVVVPTYNEAGNLPELARRLFALELPNLRLLIVDDGSPDGTGEVAREVAARYNGRLELVQRGSKLGLGTAYVAGFGRALEAGAGSVVEMDADLSHAPEYIPALLDGLAQAEVVVGSRYVPGGGVDQTWGLPRRLLSSLGNSGIRLITGLEVKDATSGFKAFRGSVLEELDVSRFQCKGFAFQAEVAHACQRRGYKVAEYPIVFAGRAEGRSKMSLAILFEAVWRLLPLRWKKDP